MNHRGIRWEHSCLCLQLSHLNIIIDCEEAEQDKTSVLKSIHLSSIYIYYTERAMVSWKYLYGER